MSAQAERGDAYLRRRSTPTGRPLPRRARDRHQLRHRPPDRRDPVRREDRRHRPPRARPQLPGDRRDQRVRRALGHDLRPAPGRPLSADGQVIVRDGGIFRTYGPCPPSPRSRRRATMRAVRRLLVALCLLLVGCGDAAAPAPVGELRQVDEFPLYELTARPDALGLRAHERPGSPAPCSSAPAAADPGSQLRLPRPTRAAARHRPPGKYASLSMVDISYLGFDRTNLRRLRDGDQLGGASRLPFDGMNERGLAVAMAQVPGARSPAGERAAGSLGVMRLVLDEAATVEEAVAIFRRTRSTSPAGRRCTTWSPTRAGTARWSSTSTGGWRSSRAGAPFQAMTNFVLTGGAPTTAICTAMGTLRRNGGRLTPGTTLALLARTAQPHTRCRSPRPARPHRPRRDGPEVRGPC